jgi:hypothetical protein
MSARHRFSAVAPESRGALVIHESAFRTFLEQRLLEATSQQVLCGLIFVRLRDGQGRSVTGDDLNQAAQIISQLVRQPDAVGVLRHATLGIVLGGLDRRGDAYVMVDRLESFAHAAGLPWVLTMGVGVFPLSGGQCADLWEACERDLEGAMSSDTWEHAIPRDTLMTRSVG